MLKLTALSFALAWSAHALLTHVFVWQGKQPPDWQMSNRGYLLGLIGDTLDFVFTALVLFAFALWSLPAWGVLVGLAAHLAYVGWIALAPEHFDRTVQHRAQAPTLWGSGLPALNLAKHVAVGFDVAAHALCSMLLAFALAGPVGCAVLGAAFVGVCVAGSAWTRKPLEAVSVKLDAPSAQNQRETAES